MPQSPGRKSRIHACGHLRPDKRMRLIDKPVHIIILCIIMIVIERRLLNKTMGIPSYN